MQNVFYMSPTHRAVYENLKKQLKPLVQEAYQQVANQPKHALTKTDVELFWVRLERYFVDFYDAFQRLYSHRSDFEQQLLVIGKLLIASYVNRNGNLKQLDLEREITPEWFERETMVGGIYYVDLFAGTLKGVEQHIPYFEELSINYVHLMPLLKPRIGPNDGGYAVEDYTKVNPELGTMQDLEELSAQFRERGISLCIDVVVNHTAKEHEWAKHAMAGDPEYLDYYLTFDDRTLPDAYEKTLPEVFPDFAPGNFTYYPEMAGGKGKWVWTTFNEFQWDLNYANPNVFKGIMAYMLYLANRGVDVLRLDAVPFMWKRMGTDCQNQPEVHDIVQAFRALMRIVAPAVIFKAEAIVSPYQLVSYLGTGIHTGRECEIAYHNSLMVLLWSSLASRKVNLMTYSLQQMPPAPPDTTWVTYIRLHDDIGWAVTDENAAAVGENGFLHRQFLNQFYSGDFLNSFARGQVFQFNPATGDGRMSGMTASLAGLEKALQENNATEIDMSIRRIMLLYSIIFSYGGIPLIYSGDEIGLLNDHGYLQNPAKAKDNRWMHRPPMDWATAENRHDPNTVGGRIFNEMLDLVAARKSTPQIHATASVQAIWTGNDHVFGFLRYSLSSGKLLALSNFSEQPQSINTNLIREQGFILEQVRDVRLANRPLLVETPLLSPDHNQLTLKPYQVVWLVTNDFNPNR